MDSLTLPTGSKTDALAARYGAAEIPPAGPWNPTIASMLGHRSVRAYRPDALPKGTLETLVAAASSAATSSNLQTWSVVAVRDPAKLAALAELAGGQKHIQQCPLFLVWLADLSRNERLGVAEATPLEGLPYFESFLVAAVDAALAAQNAVVAAESLGLATVYIGALRNDVVRVADILGLPPGAVGLFGLCVGYATDAGAGEVKPRLPQANVLHYDTYDASAEPAKRAAYDTLLSEFSRRNEMAADNWTRRVISRIGTLRALRGRDRLVGAIRSLGIALK
jgi:nitroreductase